MHDTVVANIPIMEIFYKKIGNDEYTIVGDLSYFPIDCCCEIKRDSETGELFHNNMKSPFGAVASSHANLAYKFYHKTKNCVPYLSLKASPKIMQGHNVYGTDFIEEHIYTMLGMFREYNPKFFAILDLENAHIARIDFTYHARLQSENLVDKAQDLIGELNVGQRKINKKRGKERGFKTNYFGSEHSRVGECKTYGKFQDVIRESKEYSLKAKKGCTQSKNMLKVFNAELMTFASALIRFESTNKKEMLVKQGIPTNLWEFILYQRKHRDVSQKLWSYWFDPILKSFKGSVMKDIDDSTVYDLCMEKLVTITPKGNKSYTKAKNAINFYDLLKIKGWVEIKERTHRATFHRNVKSLTEAGIPLATLQNIKKQPESILLTELVRFDFNNQTPQHYIPPVSQYRDDFQSFLQPNALVA